MHRLSLCLSHPRFSTSHLLPTSTSRFGPRQTQRHVAIMASRPEYGASDENILWYFRRDCEQRHYTDSYRADDVTTLSLDMCNDAWRSSPDSTLGQYQDCCNKLVPINIKAMQYAWRHSICIYNLVQRSSNRPGIRELLCKSHPHHFRLIMQIGLPYSVKVHAGQAFKQDRSQANRGSPYQSMRQRTESNH